MKFRPIIIILFISLLGSFQVRAAVKCNGSPIYSNEIRKDDWHNCYGEIKGQTFDFEGQFEDGKANGQGSLFQIGDPNTQFNGQFKASKRHGEGTRSFQFKLNENVTVSLKEISRFYEGKYLGANESEIRLSFNTGNIAADVLTGMDFCSEAINKQRSIKKPLDLVFSYEGTELDFFEFLFSKTGSGIGKLNVSVGNISIGIDGKLQNGLAATPAFMQDCEGSEYFGEFEKGTRNGLGRALMSSGAYVSGQWKNDKFHGLGMMHNPEIGTYFGHWERKYRHGLGIQFLNSGDIQQGRWENNKLVEHIALDEDDYLPALYKAFEAEKLFYFGLPSLFDLKLIANETIENQVKISQASNRTKPLISSSQIVVAKNMKVDKLLPSIENVSSQIVGKQGIVTGRVRDNTGIAEVTVDGMVVQVQPDGRFEHRTFIPTDGKQVLIEATDLAGLTSQKQISLSRDTAIQSASISFDSLNPIGKRVAKNTDALALIIGVEGYKNTPAQAIYADSDAKMFRDYASEKLGIPDNSIETLINDGAELTDMLLSVKNWLARSVKQDKTDVYVFFAGHGLASDDGQKMYLLPYDGSPQLLDRTAILRDELFSDIAAANPRSVTVFLDTCYSGTTRGTDMLVASRPIAIRAKQQNIPDGFTVFTAAGGDQTAKPLEEAKHGMFSYFLMKGMEGDADSNRDNQITAAELHEYVEQNVVQQSGGSQVPELQGDAGRVLVRFQ